MSSLPKKGGSKVPSEPMDWMANDASTSCLICSKLWSMKNRCVYFTRLVPTLTPCSHRLHAPLRADATTVVAAAA